MIAAYPELHASTTATEPELAAIIPAPDPDDAARIDQDTSATSATSDTAVSHHIPLRSR